MYTIEFSELEKEKGRQEEWEREGERKIGRSDGEERGER